MLHKTNIASSLILKRLIYAAVYIYVFFLANLYRKPFNQILASKKTHTTILRNTLQQTIITTTSKIHNPYFKLHLLLTYTSTPNYLTASYAQPTTHNTILATRHTIHIKETSTINHTQNTTTTPNRLKQI